MGKHRYFIYSLILLLVSLSFAGGFKTDSLRARVCNIDSGYIPKIKGSVSFTGSGTFTGTLDCTSLSTGQGQNELYPMDQDVRTTASVTHAGLTLTGNATVAGNIIGTQYETLTEPSYLTNGGIAYNLLSYDAIDLGTNTSSSGQNRSGIRIRCGRSGTTFATRLIQDGDYFKIFSGSGNIPIAISMKSGRVAVGKNTLSEDNNKFEVEGNALVNGTLNCSTINTGNGAVECYAQNQNLRTTDDVVFDSISPRTITASGNVNAGSFGSKWVDKSSTYTVGFVNLSGGSFIALEKVAGKRVSIVFKVVGTISSTFSVFTVNGIPPVATGGTPSEELIVSASGYDSNKRPTIIDAAGTNLAIYQYDGSPWTNGQSVEYRGRVEYYTN